MEISILDTRKKIIPQGALTELLGTGNWVVVVGRFDPMTAFEAEHITAFAGLGKVLGIVLMGEDCLLPVEARAVLVASLREVQAVVIAHSDEWKNFLPKNYAGPVIFDADLEEGRRQRFLGLVSSKQQSE